MSSEKRAPVSSPASRSRPRSSHPARAALPIVPGYTILVVDTNILLSSLPMFASVVESFQWTVVIPLPVIMELDGLSSNPSQLGVAAQAAMTYLSSHIRSHATSLKVQTSKGNYLTSLSVRAEQVDFADGTSERNMDDLILKAAIWQDEHWVDRSAMLKSTAVATDGAIKVVLLSLDRNCTCPHYRSVASAHMFSASTSQGSLEATPSRQREGSRSDSGLGDMSSMSPDLIRRPIPSLGWLRPRLWSTSS